MADENKILDFDSGFLFGMDTYNHPARLRQGQYRKSVNMIARGGVLQTRPGHRWKLTYAKQTVEEIPNFQGSYLFTPFKNQEQLMFAISGDIFISKAPFETYEWTGMTMDRQVDNIYFQQTQVGVESNEDGSVTVIDPYALLIIQDGKSAPKSWNGYVSKTYTGENILEMGSHMAWSGDRLWVARGRELFASAAFEPTAFDEGQYLGRAGSFILDSEITGMADLVTNGQPSLVVFTENKTYQFQSSVRDRDQWLLREVQFQNTIFEDIGCSAPRSIVSAFGMLWWWSKHGLMGLDGAMNTYRTAVLTSMDMQMQESKTWLSSDVSGICAANHDNTLVLSVPSSDAYNTDTWIADRNPDPTGQNYSIWASVWRGTRPMQWTTGYVAGTRRCFHFSKDLDGEIRLYESFTDTTTDNGQPIGWQLETRALGSSSPEVKEVDYVEVALGELTDRVDILTSIAPVHAGAYRSITDKKFDIGNVIEASEEAPEVLFNQKPQSRSYRTQSVNNVPTKTSCGAETMKAERLGVSFQVLLQGTGHCTVQSVILKGKMTNETLTRRSDETSTIVRYDGAGSANAEDLAAPAPVWTASVTVEGFTGTGVSYISQEHADYLAAAHANALYYAWLERQEEEIA